MNKKPTFDLRERINSTLSFNSAPAVRMQEGGKIKTFSNDPEYFNSQTFDKWTIKQLRTGKYGVDPESGALYKLKKPVKVPQEFLDLTSENPSDTETARRGAAKAGVESAYKNPAMYAPGSIGLGAGAGAALRAAAPGAMQLLNAPMQIGSKVFPAVTPANLMTAAGMASAPENVASGVSNIRQGNYLQGAADLGTAALDVAVPEALNVAKPLTTAGQIANKYRKAAPYLIKNTTSDIKSFIKTPTKKDFKNKLERLKKIQDIFGSTDEGRKAFNSVKSKSFEFWNTPEGERRIKKYIDDLDLAKQGVTIDDFKDAMSKIEYIDRGSQKNIEQKFFSLMRDRNNTQPEIFSLVQKEDELLKKLGDGMKAWENARAEGKAFNAQKYVFDVKNQLVSVRDDLSKVRSRLDSLIDETAKLPSIRQDNASYFPLEQKIYIGGSYSNPMDAVPTAFHEWGHGKSGSLLYNLYNKGDKNLKEAVRQPLFAKEERPLNYRLKEKFNQLGTSFDNMSVLPNILLKSQPHLMNPIPKNISKNFRNLKNPVSNEAINRFLSPTSSVEDAYRYFKTGDEPSGFIGEVLGNLIENNFIKSQSEKIDVDMLKNAIKNYRENPNIKTPVRFFDFINPTDKSLKDLADELNDLTSQYDKQQSSDNELILSAKQGGVVNRLQQKMGYKDNSPYKNLPYQDIYSDRITMSGVSRPLVATTDTGVRTVMQPGGEYYFPGATQVRETPLYSNGGGIKDRENFQTMKLYSIPKAAEGLSTTANKKRATTAKSSLNVSAELEDVLKTLGRQFGVRPSSLNRMINKIAYHESAGTFDPQLKENTGGKVWNKENWGAGLFQYKSASVQTAINRAKRFYSRYNKTIPAWLKSLEKSLDIRDLNADQQKLLAILDMAAKPNFSIKNAVKDDDSLAQEWGRGWQTQSDPQKIKKFKQDTRDYNEYVGKEDSSNLAEQAPIAGLKVTDSNAGTRGFATPRQEATPMSMDSNMSTTPQSTIQPLSAQAGIDSLSRRTGVATPKLQTFSSANANQESAPVEEKQTTSAPATSEATPSENTKNVTLYQTKNGVSVVRDSKGNVFLEKDGIASAAIDNPELFGKWGDISKYSNKQIIDALNSKGGDSFIESTYQKEKDYQINLAPYGKSLVKGVNNQGIIDLPQQGGETRYKYRYDTTVPNHRAYSVLDTRNPDKGWTEVDPDSEAYNSIYDRYQDYVNGIASEGMFKVAKGAAQSSSPAAVATKEPEFITTSSPRYVNILPQKGDPWEYRYDESSGTWETKRKDSQEWIKLDDSTENKRKAKQAIIDMYGPQLENEVKKARGKETTPVTPPPTEVAKPEAPKTGTTEAPKTEARTKVEETETLNPVERRLREWRKKQGVADPSSYDSTKSTPKQQGLEDKYYGQQEPKVAKEWADKQNQTKNVNQAQAPSQQDRSVAPLQPLTPRNTSLESINRNNFNLQPQAAEEDEAQQPVRDYYGPPYVNGGQIQKFDVGGGISKGAATGASLGAALGTIVPGLGNIVGGAVGALVGGAAGGISGAVKSNRAKREARRQDLLQRQANQSSSRQANLLGLVNMLGSGNNNSFSSLLSGPSFESMQQDYYNRSRLAPVLFQDGGDTSSPVYANATSPQTYGLQNNSTLFQGFQQTPLLEMASLTYDSQDKKQEERIVDLYDASTKTLRKAYVDKNSSFIRWADTTAPAPPDRSVAPMPTLPPRPLQPVQPNQPSRPGDRTVPPAQPLPPRGAQPVQPGQQTPVVPRDRSVPSLPTLPPRPIQPVQPGQPVPPEDRTVPSLPTLPPRDVAPAPVNPSVPSPTLPWQKTPAQPVQPSQEQPVPPENRVVEPLPPIAQRPTQPVQPGIPTRPVLPAPTPIQPREQQPVAEQPVAEQPADTQNPPSFKVQEGSYKVVNPATGQVEEVNPNDKNTTPSSKESTRNVGIYEFTWGGEDYQIIRDKSGRVFIESNGMIIPYVRSQGDSNFTSQTTTEEIINNIAQDSPNGFDESGNMRESAVQDYLRQYFGGELQKYGYIPSEDFYKGNYKRQKYKEDQVSQQQQGGPIITSLLYRNMDKNNSIKNNISMNKSKLESVINLSNKVNPYRLSPMGVYKNGGLIMEGGVSASRAGFSRQPITGASSTGPLGPKRSEVPSYTNKGVNSIMDLPTNEYVPTENMIPIQAEIGEMIVLPTGDLMPVMARRRHHQMQDDEVTDMTPENSYILSAHGQVRINRDEANLLITETGVKPYRLGQSQNPPTEKTLASVMTKKVMRPAEVAKRINSLFPVLSTDNPFEIAANIENKINRKPYLEGLIQLSELDKYRKGLSEPSMSEIEQQNMQMPQRMPGSPMLARQGRRISRPSLVTAQNGTGTGTGGNMVTLPPVGPSFIGSMYPRQIEMPQPGYSPGYWDAYAQRSQNPSEYLKGSEDTNLFSGIAAPANFAARLIGSQAIRGAERAGIARERGIYDQGFGRIGNLMTAGTAAEAAMLGAQDPFVRWTDLPDTYIRSMQTQTPASALEARTASAYANMPDYSEMGQAGLAAQNAAYARALQTGSEYAAQADERDRAAFNEQQRLLQQNLVANVTGRRQAQQATTAAINKMLSGYGNLANRFTQGQIDLTGQRMGANIGLSRAEQASKTGLYQNRLNAFTTFTGDMTAGGAEAFKALFGG